MTVMIKVFVLQKEVKLFGRNKINFLRCTISSTKKNLVDCNEVSSLDHGYNTNSSTIFISTIDNSPLYNLVMKKEKKGLFGLGTKSVSCFMSRTVN